MINNKESLPNQYENAVIALIKSKPFFARLIMTMKKDFNFTTPTAGVSVKSTGITLHLNKEFFNSLSREERPAVLMHECLHLIHQHHARFNNFKNNDRGTANVACDVAINQLIPDIPKVINLKIGDKEIKAEPASYEMLSKQIPNLQPLMSSEYYFNAIKDAGLEDQFNGGEGIIIDDHDKWQESDLTEEQKEKLVKQHVKAVLSSCSDDERQGIDQEILKDLFKSDINWKAQLRSFFANAEESYQETTRRKRNRRYGILQPGMRVEPKLKIAIAVDTSGSVSNDELNLFFGEISRIYHPNMTLYVMEADTCIRACYEYKKGMQIVAKGRGGTAYQPAIEKAKELDVDGLIYFGDGDCADQPKKPKFQVLWALVRNSPPPANFGRTIRIK